MDTASCDVNTIKAGADVLSYASFAMDADRVHSKAGLFEELSSAFNFPSYFGRNWDATSDLLRDLSWVPSSGYVLTITNSDGLKRLAGRDLETLIRVLETAIRFWKDERGEYEERTTPVAFHVVFCGTTKLRNAIAPLLRQPLCSHS
jgi:RNAse (barnase) inhibitor barstar